MRLKKKVEVFGQVNSKDLKIGEKVALRKLEGVILAIIQVGSKWSPDKFREADKVCQTRAKTHSKKARDMSGWKRATNVRALDKINAKQ